jgi:hypothetical protein
MTYTSQKLAEELHDLAREATTLSGYSNCPIPASIKAEDEQIPTPIAEFLEEAGRYAERTRAVSVGIY